MTEMSWIVAVVVIILLHLRFMPHFSTQNLVRSRWHSSGSSRVPPVEAPLRVQGWRFLSPPHYLPLCFLRHSRADFQEPAAGRHWCLWSYLCLRVFTPRFCSVPLKYVSIINCILQEWVLRLHGLNYWVQGRGEVCTRDFLVHDSTTFNHRTAWSALLLVCWFSPFHFGGVYDRKQRTDWLGPSRASVWNLQVQRVSKYPFLGSNWGGGGGEGYCRHPHFVRLPGSIWLTTVEAGCWIRFDAAGFLHSP